MDETIQRLTRELQRSGRTVEEIVNSMASEFSQAQRVEAINLLLKAHNTVRQEQTMKYWKQEEDPRCEKCNHPKSWHFSKNSCAGKRPRLLDPDHNKDPRTHHYIISSTNGSACGDCN